MARRDRRGAPFEVPREIVIRGRRWLVAYDVDLSDTMHDARSRMELGPGDLGVALHGTTYPTDHPHIKREIHLSSHNNPTPRVHCSTFLHELLHACSSQVLTMPQEEKFVSDVEVPLLRALEQLNWKGRPGD